MSFIYKRVVAKNSYFKISSINKDILDKTRTSQGKTKILNKSNNYFLRNIAVNTVKKRRLTSLLPTEHFFGENTLITIVDLILFNKIT